MSGRVAGKTAVITGAGRGQGRSHALHLAQQGADIIAIDIDTSIATIGYAMASKGDLEETARLVAETGRRVVAHQADVRDLSGLRAAIDDGVEQLGRLDVVCSNAAVMTMQRWDEVDERAWRDVIDVNLTGTWNTIAASTPHLIAAGGGSIICIGSTSAIKGTPFMQAYTAAKHGVMGVAKSMANELAMHSIRVNTVHPAGVKTMLTAGLAGFDELLSENPPTRGIFENSLPTEWVEQSDISHAVVYLASDESRFVTGTELKVDAGNTNR